MIKLLLLQVFLWTSGQAFCYTSVSPDLDSKHGAYFQEDHNDKALILEEVSEGINFEITSGKEKFSGTSHPGEFLNIGLAYSTKYSSKFTLDLQTDQRSILKSRIFPFHYFW